MPRSAAGRDGRTGLGSAPVSAGDTTERRVALDLLAGRAGRLSFRNVSVLRVIAAESGLSNKEVALRAGVRDEGQISRVLARLARLGLLESARDPRIPGATHAWRLTPLGQRLEAAVRDETPAPERRLALEDNGARLDHRMLSLLRAIGEQPGLASGELALAAGFAPAPQASEFLSRLERLGLAQSTPQPCGRGTARVWRLTDTGAHLHDRLRDNGFAPLRSAARELMRESGGPLGERAISLLRAIGVEPGIANRDLASRVGTSTHTDVSGPLVLLRRRGLIETTRDGAPENAWRLTPSGKRLHHAIARETPAPPRGVALELIRTAGVPLNHRSVAMLLLIGREPALSNIEITRRAGLESPGHASTLLARLAHHGLVQSRETAGRKNAWHLTDSGRRLTAAIADDLHTPATARTAGT